MSLWGALFFGVLQAQCATGASVVSPSTMPWFDSQTSTAYASPDGRYVVGLARVAVKSSVHEQWVQEDATVIQDLKEWRRIDVLSHNAGDIVRCQWSSDGTSLLVNNRIASNVSRSYIYDPLTGRRTELPVPAGLLRKIQDCQCEIDRRHVWGIRWLSEQTVSYEVSLSGLSTPDAALHRKRCHAKGTFEFALLAGAVTVSEYVDCDVKVQR